MEPAQGALSEWRDYEVPLSDLPAPLEAHTARVVPREALEHRPIAVPLIAWQR